MRLWIQLSILSFFLSASALAKTCPSLEGSYICRGSGQTQQVSIQQDLRNDVWTYYLNFDENDLTIVTDGNERNIGEFGRVQNAKYTADCQKAVLKIKASGNINVAGRSFSADTDMDFAPTSNGDITATTRLRVNGRVAPPAIMNCNAL